MNKKQYEAKRTQLMNEAQNLIDQGKAEEAEAKMQEVYALDEQWEAIAQAQANLNALNGAQPQAHPFAVDGSANMQGEQFDTPEAAWESETYVNAWARNMMRLPLSDAESEAFALVNEAFTHTTGNTSIVIPKTVAKGIWEEAGKLYPYFNDISKTYVNGVLSMIQEDTSSEAGWYEEDKETEDGKETFKEFTLNGCELSRSITVSWKLQEMAIEDFIPYIQRKLGKKMGAAAGYGVTYGAGPAAAEGKPEPTGVVTALLNEAEQPQVVKYAAGGVPTWEEITKARGCILSGYGAGLAVYANSKTIWNKLANVVDKNGRPMFMADGANGVYKILGSTVKEDDSMKDGDILFSNPDAGYGANINKEMTVLPEQHVKKRKTDYCAYSIMDGNATTTKAHALLTETAGE